MKNKNKLLIVSAINIIEGGTLNILKDTISSASKFLNDDWNILVLVNNKKLIDESRPDFLEFPKSKKSWFFRLYYEYIYFYFFSKKLKPDLWLSLHDISPNVSAKKEWFIVIIPLPFTA